jgi:hypothetical protein
MQENPLKMQAFWHVLGTYFDTSCWAMQQNEPILVDAKECIDRLFAGRKPSLRTFREWQARGMIPFKKIGRLTLFDPFEVRTAIDKRHSVKAVQSF